mmetsp:Transcript_84900/g.216252  ORF Transcript_84900/g.216252 Transcript_84900/m.216252 type:complete len:236 (+) Transcript_84900:305-1012(+)
MVEPTAGGAVFAGADAASAGRRRQWDLARSGGSAHVSAPRSLAGIGWGLRVHTADLGRELHECAWARRFGRQQPPGHWRRRPGGQGRRTLDTCLAAAEPARGQPEAQSALARGRCTPAGRGEATGRAGPRQAARRWQLAGPDRWPRPDGPHASLGGAPWLSRPASAGVLRLLLPVRRQGGELDLLRYGAMPCCRHGCVGGGACFARRGFREGALCTGRGECPHHPPELGRLAHAS